MPLQGYIDNDRAAVTAERLSSTRRRGKHPYHFDASDAGDVA